jgi:Uma2 family endonuclease
MENAKPSGLVNEEVGMYNSRGRTSRDIRRKLEGRTMWSRVEIAERMCATEFWKDAPETQKAELIDGVMMMASPAMVIHERLFGFLFNLLSLYVATDDLGEVFGSRTAVELAEDQVYEPDILFIAKERRSLIQPKGIVGAPDFVIEILSASTAANERGPKRRGYERAGVPELWLIDPHGPLGTEFFRLESGRYVAQQPDGQGILRSAAVPGFLVDTAWLWPQEHFVSVQTALFRIRESANPT